VALITGFLYNSVFNISNSIYNNSQYNIIFPTATGNQTIAINMPDGFYDSTGSAGTIDGYLDFIMAQNNLYLIDNNGNNVYYLDIEPNSAYYRLAILSTPVPNALPTGWSYPPGGYAFGVGLPATTLTPQIQILNNNFQTITGFVAGTYPPIQQSTVYSVDGTNIPEVSPQYAFNINCNLVNNSFVNSAPNGIFQFSFTNTTFGDQLALSPYQLTFYDVMPNQYNSIIITITDQQNRPALLNDPASQFTLYLRSKQRK
jgi:hypothetical protein